MNILDNPKILAEYSASRVPGSITALPKQMVSGWEVASKTRLSSAHSEIDNIVFCGMGGSNLASEMIGCIFRDEIKKPLTLVRNYSLPKFVNKKTLVFVSSYSGDTEEAVSCLKEAINLKAKIICLTSGGKIASLARRYKLPLCKIDKKDNPSGQPSYGTGSQV